MGMNGKNEGMLKRLGVYGRTQLRRLIITFEFFDRNGLANHAAAGSYGFLLSAAPMLLIVSFFLLAAFRSSPQAIFALTADIPFLETVLDEDRLNLDFLVLSRPGISGLISVVSIIWAGRVFALSLQRGLKIIFTGTKKRNPLADNLAAFGIEFMALIFAMIMILGSQTARHFFTVLDSLPFSSAFTTLTAQFRHWFFPAAALGLVSFCAYLLIPANPPRRLSALWGSVCCVTASELTALVLRIIIDQARYRFLYGALGSLIVLLVNVYFFFSFFFFGAQLAFVLDYFDALYFSKLYRIRAVHNRIPPGIVMRNLFFNIEENLGKYFKFFEQGELIMKKGDSGDDAFYLLEGEVEVFIPAAGNNVVSVLRPGSFFGEMGHLISETRSASVRAKTRVSALALPFHVFDAALKLDPRLNRAVIQGLSRRLKSRNE
jgi:membrane protein